MRLALLCLLVPGCTDAFDAGRAVACHDCGPGSVTAGRFVADARSYATIAGDAAGRFVRSADNVLALVDEQLNVAATLSFDGRYGDLDVGESAIAPDGGAVVVAGWYDDFESNNTLVAVDARGREQWRQDIGRGEGPGSIAVGDALVFVATGAHDQHITLGGQMLAGRYIVALDRATGDIAWMLSPGAVGSNRARVVALPDGGCAFASELEGTETSAGPAIVVAVDAAGNVRWTRQADASGDHPFSRIDALAAGPGGELAFPVWWGGEGLTLGGRTVPSDIHGQLPGGTALALLAPTGDVRWLRSLRSSTESVESVATDGSAVAIGGRYNGAGVSFDPAPVPASDTDFEDGFVGLLTSESAPAAWVALARGVDYQLGSVLALAPDRVLFLASSSAGQDDPPATMAFGGVTADGSGFLYGTLQR